MLMSTLSVELMTTEAAFTKVTTQKLKIRSI
jgi:hypothetical protein